MREVKYHMDKILSLFEERGLYCRELEVKIFHVIRTPRREINKGRDFIEGDRNEGVLRGSRVQLTIAPLVIAPAVRKIAGVERFLSWSEIKVSELAVTGDQRVFNIIRVE